ncbi:MAG: transcription antitermination protein NusB [Micromonosporaceae bacterium]|nr:transcription antitermination protein NusB [Micromonosporaceae bacterium]
MSGTGTSGTGSGFGRFTGSEVTSSMSARRKARKRALDVLYEADLRQSSIMDSLEAYVARLPEPRPEQIGYSQSLVAGVARERDRIDELIGSYAEGWTLDRMPVVDRNLARIAVYELLYVDEIDDAVAITEAVELARILSTDESPRFLHGVLGRIAEYATR